MFEHIADAISTPPLIQLDEWNYLIRFESMKVASAVKAVEHLLTEKVIHTDSILIDSSSGVYAYALALACHKFHLRCHLIISTAADEALKLQLTFLGATYEQVPSTENLRTDQTARIARLQEYLAIHENAYWMQQYHDRIHYLSYYSLAEKISLQLDTHHLGQKKITLIGGVGSGVSTGGLTQGLIQLDKEVKTVGIQPFGSISFNSEHIKDDAMLIAGIGSSIPFRNIDYTIYAQIDWVSSYLAELSALNLLRKHGIFAGISTGAAYLSSTSLNSHQDDAINLIISPDLGHKYLTRYMHHSIDECDAIKNVAPFIVSHPRDIQLPWSSMLWNNDSLSPRE